jgi:Cys-tRNA synthase (O-phospho-L-seryl-tRNA:Cys-tRNA synthase)
LKHELVEILRLFTEINEKGVVELLEKLMRYLSASSGRISTTEVRIAMNTAFTTGQKQEDWFQDFIDELKEEGSQTIIFRLLDKRFGNVSDDIKTQIQELSLAELERFSEDLLDFESLQDVRKWFLKKSN